MRQAKTPPPLAFCPAFSSEIEPKQTWQDRMWRQRRPRRGISTVVSILFSRPSTGVSRPCVLDVVDGLGGDDGVLVERRCQGGCSSSCSAFTVPAPRMELASSSGRALCRTLFLVGPHTLNVAYYSHFQRNSSGTPHASPRSVPWDIWNFR